ncbi:MAG: aquaporin family protein [Betaproteobacteria bacterium]|nr:aquaporin family protein [Betaproteobacteria bacterium]
MASRTAVSISSEALGTALLLAVIVGSGIMAEQLAHGNIAIALLANAIATGAALFALITIFAPQSGAHFNPLVTLAEYLDRNLSARHTFITISAQIIGAIVGVIVAHAMFALPLLQQSQHTRHGNGQWLSEFIATFGLLTVILHCRQFRPQATPAVVAAYITAAYWFTASTAFANPAVTLARALTDTFAGIHPHDVPPFIAAQLLGALAAWAYFRWAINTVSQEKT